MMLTLRLERYVKLLPVHGCLYLYLCFMEFISFNLTSDATVVVSMFDSLAQTFHNKLLSYGSEPRIVLATSINPKIVGG